MMEELVSKFVDIPKYEGQPCYNMILDEDIENGIDDKDDELYDEIEEMAKELPEDIAQVYHSYIDTLIESDKKKEELNKQIPEQEKKVSAYRTLD